MKKILFCKQERIFKANLHCHTVISDGSWTPEETKDRYKAKGYSIVAFSDHNILVNHSDLNDEDFLALNACEMEIIQRLPYAPYDRRTEWINKVYHFNLFAGNPKECETPKLPDMDYEDIDAINQYIRDRAAEGFLVSYNHPCWSLQTYEDYAPLKGCFAMEIYNHGCEVDDGYYGYNPQVYDEMLRLGNRLYCLATDDNHFDTDTFGGFVMINSGELEYEKVYGALKSGNFYASRGPEIKEISLEGNKLLIRCSMVELIIVYTNGRNCYIKKEENLTDAEFELSGTEKYIRVVCRDRYQKDACSNAYWLS